MCTDPYAGKPLLESARRCSQEEVKHVVARRGSPGPDPVALVEIDLYGDLMIAASSADEDRLSTDRIDEVLRVEADRSHSADRAKADRSHSADRRRTDRPVADRPAAGRPTADRDPAPAANRDPDADDPDAG
ncbi:hypothetical protein [Streptomyces cucumeris]|uniref:hypothetical protein n=1 Tax=Streptomyces cucumeris TaxID=2962890 RepID=UPI0020C88959|nr:hypothetical protein [Streptomyces sp. NEAU-Y11]MCP9212172.1 hypothetical protein [Streptomyces sp. NEAU-Y11]